MSTGSPTCCTEKSTFTGRKFIWDFVNYEIGRRPLLGWGYQSFWLVGADGPSVLEAPGWVKTMPNGHNGYLDTMLELGYGGFYLLLAFVFLTVHACGRVADRDPLRAWLVLSLVFFIVISNGLESWWMRAFEFLWVLFLILAAEIGRHWRPAVVPSHRLRPYPWDRRGALHRPQAVLGSAQRDPFHSGSATARSPEHEYEHERSEAGAGCDRGHDRLDGGGHRCRSHYGGICPASRGMGEVVDEPIEKADAIVVSLISGGAGALEAADLVQSGIATKVAVFADPPHGRRPRVHSPRASLRQREREAGSSAEVAQGVGDVVEIDRTYAGTQGIGEVLQPWCDQHKFRSIVFVAARDHSRRLRRVLDREMKGHPVQVMVRPARYSSFDPERWWHTRSGIRTRS